MRNILLFFEIFDLFNFGHLVCLTYRKWTDWARSIWKWRKYVCKLVWLAVDSWRLRHSQLGWLDIFRIGFVSSKLFFNSFYYTVILLLVFMKMGYTISFWIVILLPFSRIKLLVSVYSFYDRVCEQQNCSFIFFIE